MAEYYRVLQKYIPGNIKYLSGSSGKGRESRCQGIQSNPFTG